MKWKKWNRSSLLLPVLWLFFSTCAPATRKMAAGSPTDRATPKSSAVPPAGDRAHQLVFISMTMSQEATSGSRIIQVQEVVKSPGTLKSKEQGSLGPGPYLNCILFQDKTRLDSIRLEHPLFKSMEFINDQNRLSRQAVQLAQAEFFIRFQQGNANRLKIEERLPGTRPQELIFIKF
jgi:hypothetical protein